LVRGRSGSSRTARDILYENTSLVLFENRIVLWLDRTFLFGLTGTMRRM